VFVCDDCHHRLHANKHTIYYHPTTQTWNTRAATWNEIPPDPKPRLDQHRNNQKRHDPHGDRLF